ncbi:Chaperone protein DnaJ like [Verticillium longisporum]|uniref:Chaperone protein DnaJ like n=1 Tax=Verticillium longisporum TaxID=100787 RepID=A0A8I2ZB71_VERLO|nr:Chaperone protein DnaJ like [Verticillium longisporum]
MSNFLSLLGWSFLPNFVTGWTQTIYYSITIRAGDPPPQPGSARYITHRRRIHFLVVSLYLLYTLYEADHDLRRDGSFYADLGLSTLAPEDREIKSRFRRLAAVHHPDKSSDADGASRFIHLKLASDTLLNPAARFAYDRFGREVTQWQRLTTVRDYLARGVLQSLLPHYAVAAAALYGLGLLGYLDWGRYWRWLLLAALCLFELTLVTRPLPPAFLTAANALTSALTTRQPLLPFQLIALARKASITLYIAFNQLGPLIDESLHQGLERLDALAHGLDHDAAKLLSMEMVPYAGDAEALGAVRAKVKDWLVQNTIRADPMVKDAVGNSIRRRRTDAPAGAKGTR